MRYYDIVVLPLNMIKKILFLLLFCPTVVFSAHITDRLLAGMYETASSEQKPVKLLPSGTPVELIGEKGSFIKVQLVDGKVGWVEKRFLSDDKPAKVRLLALQSKYRKLQAKLDLAEKSLLESKKKADTQVKSPASVVGDQQQGAVNTELKTNSLPQPLGAGISLEKEPVDEQESSYLTALLALLLLAIFLALGVAIGFWLQDQRQLKRHGGFRI